MNSAHKMFYNTWSLDGNLVITIPITHVSVIMIVPFRLQIITLTQTKGVIKHDILLLLLRVHPFMPRNFVLDLYL